jgi:hypothetical protein
MTLLNDLAMIYRCCCTHIIIGAIEDMLILAIMRMGKYYRTTIPREIRMFPGINEGDEVEWMFESDKMVIRKKDEKYG